MMASDTKKVPTAMQRLRLALEHTPKHLQQKIGEKKGVTGKRNHRRQTLTSMAKVGEWVVTPEVKLPHLTMRKRFAHLAFKDSAHNSKSKRTEDTKTFILPPIVTPVNKQTKKACPKRFKTVKMFKDDSFSLIDQLAQVKNQILVNQLVESGLPSLHDYSLTEVLSLETCSSLSGD